MLNIPTFVSVSSFNSHLYLHFLHYLIFNFTFNFVFPYRVVSSDSGWNLRWCQRTLSYTVCILIGISQCQGDPDRWVSVSEWVWGNRYESVRKWVRKWVSELVHVRDCEWVSEQEKLCDGGVEPLLVNISISSTISMSILDKKNSSIQFRILI